MVTTKQKGTNAEKKVQLILEEEGYNVIRSPRTMKPLWIKGKVMYISKDNDYYNLFDLIAKNKICTRWIQVKATSPNMRETLKKPIEEFQRLCGNDRDTFEVWFIESRQKPVVFECIDGTWARKENW